MKDYKIAQHKDTHPEALPAPDELFHKKETFSTDHTGHKENKENEKNTGDKSDQEIPDYTTKGTLDLFLFFFVVIIFAAMLYVNIFGYHFFSINSSSMASVLSVGSLLVTKEVPAETLKEGDIITFMTSDGVCVTHQIVNIFPNYHNSGEPAYRTKGTENVAPDKELVLQEQILGKVLFHIPGLGGMIMNLQGLFSR